MRLSAATMTRIIPRSAGAGPWGPARRPPAHAAQPPLLRQPAAAQVALSGRLRYRGAALQGGQDAAVPSELLERQPPASPAQLGELEGWAQQHAGPSGSTEHQQQQSPTVTGSDQACCCSSGGHTGPELTSSSSSSSAAAAGDGGTPEQRWKPARAAALAPTPQAAAAATHPAPSRGVLYFIGSVAAVVVSGVANRVLYKMAVTPLSNYVFFMAQLQTFGYCAVYFTILAARYRSGRVSREALGVPRAYLGLFTRIGVVEAVASLLGFLGASNLPGVVLPLLSQTGLFWQVLLARFLLRKHLSRTQVGGVLLVVAGVVLAAWPARGANSVLANVHPGYAWLFIFSMLFPALDCIYKERIFREVRQQQGADLDLFVVNSFGSLAQAVFVFALLPVMTMVRGMALTDLPAYVANGFQCLRGLTPACGSDCAGAPLLPLAYVATNLVFNIAALSLIRVAGNVVVSLVMSAMVPLTIFAFTMDLPFLPPAPPVGPTFLAGTAVLVAGLVAYNAPLWAPALHKRLAAWLAEGRAGNGGGGVASVVAG